jgi:hypothetical protein
MAMRITRAMREMRDMRVVRAMRGMRDIRDMRMAQVIRVAKVQTTLSPMAWGLARRALSSIQIDTLLRMWFIAYASLQNVFLLKCCGPMGLKLRSFCLFVELRYVWSIGQFCFDSHVPMYGIHVKHRHLSLQSRSLYPGMSSSSGDRVGSKRKQRDEDGKDATALPVARVLSEQRLQELADGLCQAAVEGSIGDAQRLLGQGADVNMQQTQFPHETPLVAACTTDQERMVKFVLSCRGVDVNKSDGADATPLFVAAAFGHVSILKLLLSLDEVDRDQPNEFGMTPLMTAAGNKHTEAVHMLLRRGINVNMAANNGNTALLMTLIGYSNSSIDCASVVLLVVCGADTALALQEYPLDAPKRALIDAALAARDDVQVWLAARRAEIVESLEALSPLMPSAVLHLTTTYDAPSQMDAVDAMRLADPAWWLNLTAV